MQMTNHFQLSARLFGISRFTLRIAQGRPPGVVSALFAPRLAQALLAVTATVASVLVFQLA
jgi:hypothetical protein